MLPRKYRLSKSSEIEELKNGGRLFSGEDLSIIVAKSASNETTRFTFLVSTKVSKKATERNRIRRMLSSMVYELVDQVDKGSLVLFLSRKTIVEANKSDVKSQTRKLLTRAGLLK